jgi:hypothetical protein
VNEIFDDLIKEIADNCVKSFNDKSKSLLPSEEKIVEKLKYMGIISKRDEDNHLSLTAGSVSYALNESFEIGRDKLKLLVIPQDKVREIASQICETLQKDEREYNSKNGIDYFDYELDDEDKENYENKQIGLITDLLKKEYEKYTPIEISRGNEDERLKFNFAISNITKNLKMLNFDKEKVEENIGVDINFLKQGEKEKYLIEVSNGNKNLEISSNNLPDLKDKLVKLLEKNIEDTKEFYKKNYREDFGENRQKRLKILKKMDIKDLEIGTKANIQFEYEENAFNMNVSLKVEKDDKLIVKTNFKNLLGNEELTQIIKNENLSDFLGRGFFFLKNSDEYEKIDFTKRKTEYYMEKLDKIIEETSLKDAVKDINSNTIACLFSDDKEWNFENFSDIAKEYFDISFNNRIDIIKDKESLVMNNLEELKLTTDDILNNKEDKEKLINEILQFYKENSFNNFLEEVEKMKQIEIDADYVYDDDKSSEQYILVESLNHLEENKNFIASSDFFNIQEYNIKNLIAITVDEEKLPLSKEQLDYFRTIDNKTKENLYDSVISRYNDMSDTMSGEIDKKSFLEVCDSFRPNDYKELVNINLEIKEKEKSNENSKEKQGEFKDLGNGYVEIKFY